MKKYVYLKKLDGIHFDELIIGNVYDIWDSPNICGIYLNPILGYDLYISLLDLNYNFLLLEEWREQQINKILNYE